MWSIKISPCFLPVCGNIAEAKVVCRPHGFIYFPPSNMFDGGVSAPWLYPNMASGLAIKKSLTVYFSWGLSYQISAAT